MAAAAGPGTAHEPVPTLTEALAAMLPACVPLIEHKAGSAKRYVEFLRTERRTDEEILQSFDWHYLAQLQQLAPEIAIGALGPNPAFETLTAAAIHEIRTLGAQLVHWRATDLTRETVELAHAQGLLVCTYTTDDEPGWRNGRALGVDARHSDTHTPIGLHECSHECSSPPHGLRCESIVRVKSDG